MSRSEPENEKRFPVIPEGERPCIWMEMGLVTYKICDRDLDCDGCPLDIGLRGQAAPPQSGRPNRGGKGLRIPVLSKLLREGNDDRFFHPNHTWVTVTSPDEIRIGIDSIAAIVLGSIDELSIPSVNRRIRRGSPCCQVVQGPRVFSIPSPVSGRVIARNEELVGFGDMLVLDPMAKGWICTLAPDDLEADLKLCRVGDSVVPWYLQELEWLDSVLERCQRRHEELVGETVFDGGELSRNLRDLLPADEYRNLVWSLLHCPKES